MVDQEWQSCMVVVMKSLQNYCLWDILHVHYFYFIHDSIKFLQCVIQSLMNEIHSFSAVKSFCNWYTSCNLLYSLLSYMLLVVLEESFFCVDWWRENRHDSTASSIDRNNMPLSVLSTNLDKIIFSITPLLGLTIETWLRSKLINKHDHNPLIKHNIVIAC